MTNDAPAPRRAELLSRWHVDIRWRAYGLISYQADGTIANRDLAQQLGIDMRALHAVLHVDPHFLVEIRWNQQLRRGEPWWRINHDLKAPPKPDLPRLLPGSPRNLRRVAHKQSAAT
jgi:hypothetical protein